MAGRERPEPSLCDTTTLTFSHVKRAASKAGSLARYPPPLDLFRIICYNIKKDLFKVR